LSDATATHPSLTRDQRASGVAALRAKQEADARGARRRVLTEERQNDTMPRGKHGGG